MTRSMSKVLPGLYIGSIWDAQNVFKSNSNNITHVISLRSSPKRILKLYHYLHVPVSDTKDQNIAQYFRLCNDVIHRARLESKDNNVLVHCYAGISRSATIVIAYLMTIANLKWDVAWRALEAVRSSVKPNPVFQEQLRRFERYGLKAEQRRLYNKFPSKRLQTWDLYRIEALLHDEHRFENAFYSNGFTRSSSSNNSKISDDEDDYFYDCLTGEEAIDNDGDYRYFFA